MAVLVDTGVWVSAADTGEPRHPACADVLQRHRGELIVTAPVVAGDDYLRCIALIETYADMGLGLVDASVVAIAERLELITIATLNERDFRVVRPAHTDAFELLP